MNKISKRIKEIASLVDKGATILDVGTDHGYLPIYLVKNKLVKKAYASDISKNALSYAEKNIKEENLNIKTYVSDGIKDIKVKYDTLIITGMGFHTIEGILENKNLPDTLILQSNSEHYNLRKYMNKIGYKIEKEITLKDKKIYYVIIKYKKEFEKLNYIDLLFGKSNNKDYFISLYNKNKEIIKSVPFLVKFGFIKKNILLKMLILFNKKNK